MSNQPMLTLGGLWVNEDKNGNKFMSGTLGMLRLLIFKNTNKQSDKSPDYWIKVVEKPRDDAPKTSAPPAADGPSTPPADAY